MRPPNTTAHGRNTKWLLSPTRRPVIHTLPPSTPRSGETLEEHTSSRDAWFLLQTSFNVARQTESQRKTERKKEGKRERGKNASHTERRKDIDRRKDMDRKKEIERKKE